MYTYIYIILVLFGNAFPATWPWWETAGAVLPAGSRGKASQNHPEHSSRQCWRYFQASVSQYIIKIDGKKLEILGLPRFHSAVISAVLGMTPRGWTGQILGVDFQEMGLSWHRRKDFRNGVWEGFWKMASELATAPKFTQPCVRNQRKELMSSSPSLGLGDWESLFLCSPSLGWLCCSRRRHSRLSTILEIS